MYHQLSTRYHLRQISPKENNRNHANEQFFEDQNFKRYPEIQSKIQRLMNKIDTLVQQNINLKQSLETEQMNRITKEKSMKQELQKYQLHQKEIESCIDQLQAKAVNNSKQNSNQNIINSHESQIQSLKKEHQCQIQKIKKQFKTKQENLQENLNKVNLYLKQSYNRLQFYDQQVGQLKLLVQQINSLNKDLAVQNKQIKSRINQIQNKDQLNKYSEIIDKNKQLQRQIQQLKKYNQEFVNKISIKQNEQFKSSRINQQISQKMIQSKLSNPQKSIVNHQYNICKQQQQIRDLLIGISRLEYKLEKSYTYIQLLEKENGLLKESIKNKTE